MGIPLRQSLAVLRYVLRQRLRGVERYPLVLMLEPLFRCNLACAGCGKIDYPEDILDRRLSPAECMAAIDECGAPVVSIAGGEPLIHKEMPEIVRGFVMDDYIPSPYLTFSVHLDGNRERHDASVCRSGVFDQAVESIQKALQRRFRVTINCTLFQGESAQNVAAFLDDVMALGVEGVTISPGFNYQHAPQQDVFIQRNASKELFRSIFELGKNRAWRLNHSSLFLNFLAGNETYRCTPWGNPTRNVFGWQRPCYLLVDEGYAPTFKALLEETDWKLYGTGNNPKCANCMAHCGYETTAVNDTINHPLKAVRVFLRGPRTEGAFAPELPMTYSVPRTGSDDAKKSPGNAASLEA